MAPAKSLAEAINKSNLPVEPALYDCLSEANAFARVIIEDGYRMLQSRAKWMYGLIYALTKNKLSAKFNANLVSFFIKNYIKKLILNDKPAKIVIFHFFLIKPVFAALKDLNLDIPVTTVVTDPFTAHTLWFLNKDQDMIVSSERLKNTALEKGIKEKRIKLFPFILNDKFSEPATSEEILNLKIKYGLNPNKKMIFILGGGDGIPRGKKILETVLKANFDADIVMVCGNNKTLRKKAETLKRKYNKENLFLFGFVDFVYDLINMSDAVITKGGASTFMEIVSLNKFQIVTDYIWEQEKGNVEFLVEQKIGMFEPNISKIPEIISDLFHMRGIYPEYMENIKKFKFQNGRDQIAEFLAKD